MKSNITLETFEGIVIEQLKERGCNTKIVETPGKLGSEHRLIKEPRKDGLSRHKNRRNIRRLYEEADQRTSCLDGKSC